MKLTVISAICSIACLLSPSVSVAAESAAPISDLPTALTAAKDSGKPIFIYVFDSV